MDFTSNVKKISIGKIKASTQNLYNKAVVFGKEIWMETNPKTGKVTWPNRKIIVGSTIAVLIAVVLIAIFIGIADVISMSIVKLFLR